MPILIQDFASGAFLTAEGEWTPRPQQAVRFDQVLRAWDEVYDRSLCGVRIVFQPKEKEPQRTVAAIRCRPVATF